jgi:pyruvate ferredoxin oxidoreductase beta subunit
MAKPLRLKELANETDRLAPGHRLCAGCAESVIVRQMLAAIEEPVVIANATGCLEVATTIYPYTAWRVPWIHSAFENAAATGAGMEAMYRSLVRQGKIEDRNLRFLVFGGDGATYDIGLQWISGAFERGHKLTYVCFNNEAYMNTGIQRSGATPLGAHTTTSPAGDVIPGKTQWRKPITDIMAAHRIPYVAQASPSHWRDLMKKTQKAVGADGPAFLNVISDCNRGWRHATDTTMEVLRMAVNTCYWPLFEVENGEWKITYRPRQKPPVEEWLKMQGRFRHLFQPKNRHLIDEIQRRVDEEWDLLRERAGET